MKPFNWQSLLQKRNKDKLIFLGPVHNWAGSFEDPDGLQGDEGEEGEGESGEDEWQQYSCYQHVNLKAKRENQTMHCKRI